MAGPSLGNRAAREDELAAISALEQSGEKQFRAAGMDRIAGAPAPGPDVYRPALDDGRLLVAVDPRDRPVGFIRLEMLDGDPHIEQVSVHPDHGDMASEHPCWPPPSSSPAIAGTAGQP